MGTTSPSWRWVLPAAIVLLVGVLVAKRLLRTVTEVVLEG
jgi:hypothetical protein